MRAVTRSVVLLALLAAGLTQATAASAAEAPVVIDTWVAGVSSVGVDLRAAVDPGEAPTNARFEYISDFAFRSNLAAVPARDPFAGAVGAPVAGISISAASVAVEVKQAVGGLRAGTTYHVRVVATNNEGAGTGPARVFTIRTPGEGATLDGRGWEMVSPVDKNGGEIQGPSGVFGGGVFQAAAGGGAITYSSLFSFGSGLGAPGANQYVSRRGANGWATENVTTPTLAGAFGVDPDGVPYQLLSGDLARGIVLDPGRCDDAPCPRRYQLRQSADGALASSAAASDLTLAGSNRDLSRVVLSTCAALTADAAEAPAPGGGCDPAAANLYAWSGGAPTLLNLLPGDSASTPGASLAAAGAGSISDDGGRVYFELAGDLYLRNGGETVQVDAAVGGGGDFQAAGADGGVAFFLKAGHLYRYTVAAGLATDLTPAAGVVGVLGASEDGAYVYYLSAAGLFLAHGGTVTRVADGAEPSDYPPSTGTARVAADGSLLFLSADVPSEVDSGGFPRLYLYAPAGASLTCVSCNPSGARPVGPSTIPGAVANGELPGALRAYKPRVLSAAGNRVFFESVDALVLADSNGQRDVYEWEAQGVGSCTEAGGCLGLLSSGLAEAGARFLDASADGADAFFLTAGALVATDPGGADVYDARVGGGFPAPFRPIACVADACQVVPDPPEDPALGTGFFRAEGNPPLAFPKAGKQRKKADKKKHRKRPHRKKQQHRKTGGRS